MALANRTMQVIREAFADLPAAADLIANINGGAAENQSAPVVPVAITYTASASTYTPTGALTIANGSSPTNTELLELCLELRRNIAELEAVLLAAGLVT